MEKGLKAFGWIIGCVALAASVATNAGQNEWSREETNDEACRVSGPSSGPTLEWKDNSNPSIELFLGPWSVEPLRRHGPISVFFTGQKSGPDFTWSEIGWHESVGVKFYLDLSQRKDAKALLSFANASTMYVTFEGLTHKVSLEGSRRGVVLLLDCSRERSLKITARSKAVLDRAR
jgi:hypothetical protein